MTVADRIVLVLPVLVPLATAAVGLLLRSRGGRRWRVTVGLTGAALNVAVAGWLLARAQAEGVLVTQLGGWMLPMGIGFAADRLGAAMVFVASLVGLLGGAFAVPTLEGARTAERFVVLLQLMLAGLGGFFLTADLFNFYVWYELILTASFGLMVLSANREQFEGAAKYFMLNILGSMLLLVGVALLYTLTGTLHFAGLAQRLDELGRPALSAALGTLLLVALGIKSAAFPLFFWLPAAYHAPPIAVTAIFGGVLTKVGVYGLLRLFTLLFVHAVGYTHGILLVLGGLTMIAGVLGAVAQHDLRRLLSFLIISEIGFVLIGLGFYTAAGIAAAIYFVLHIIVTKTALFFISGTVRRLRGSFDLDRIGGLYAERPAFAALFLIPALSLGGIPPFSGFVGKLALTQAGLAEGRYLVVGVALAVSLLTLYSMVKIWTQAFWAPAPAGEVGAAARRAAKGGAVPVLMWGPAVVLAVLAVALGLAAEPVMDYVAEAARGLLERERYIEAVLGGAG